MSNKNQQLIHQLLETPDFAACERDFGITFVAPTTEQLLEFDELCAKLVHKQQNVLAARPDLTPDKPATCFDLAAFLDKPLTAKQAVAINERETPRIAEYCVGVQAQLAKVPIKESRQRLTHLPTELSRLSVAATFSEIPFPEVAGEWAGKPQEFWARHGFAERLAIMGLLLNTEGVQPHFIEVFRPEVVQAGMFARRVKRTAAEHPGWTNKQILAESRSKTASAPRLAAHMSGAAADVMLQDTTTGNMLDFGHSYSDGGVLVFPRTPFVTHKQWRNRQLLQICAGLAGLTLYVGEDWHVSFGDHTASLDENATVRPDYQAIFGPVKAFDHSTGEITEQYDATTLNHMFPYEYPVRDR